MQESGCIILCRCEVGVEATATGYGKVVVDMVKIYLYMSCESQEKKIQCGTWTIVHRYVLVSMASRTKPVSG